MKKRCSPVVLALPADVALVLGIGPVGASLRRFRKLLKNEVEDDLCTAISEVPAAV